MAINLYELTWAKIIFADSEAELREIFAYINEKRRLFTAIQYERMLGLIQQIRLHIVHPN